MAASAAGPPWAATQEVRFAVVMYGGVSLAIYINGVAQELLHLVRATAPAEAPTVDAVPSAPLVADADLTGSERVYRTLGQLLAHGDEAPVAELPPADAPIRTRFVVDIVSGTSAGGINGIFLAKALAVDGRLDQIRKLWFDEGDIAHLIADGQSYQGTDLARQPPESLLNSRRMYERLFQAFEGMDPERAPGERSRLVDELDLWVTATDIRGLPLPLSLFDRVVYEPRYKNVFRFAYANPFADEADQPRNDFVHDNNPLLAFAARATSSFPFAFDPMELAATDALIPADRQLGSWASFFPDYVRQSAPGSTAYRDQAFGDGGYLDNKPFTWATGTLSRRRAELPVDRKLIYVEPDPGTADVLRRDDPDHPATSVPADTLLQIRPKPDPLENVRAAMIVLPRRENIRDDLADLLERNRQTDRIEWATAAVDDALAAGWQPLDAEQWVGASPEDAAARYGLQYGAYFRLKIALVLDDLAELVTVLAGLDPDSDERSAIRCFVQAWFELTQTTDEARNRFLIDYDLAYRLRRLNFVIRETGRLPVGADAGAVGELRRQLTAQFLRLRAGGRALRNRDPAQNPLVPLLAGMAMPRAELLSILDGTLDQGESVARATAKLQASQELRGSLDDFAAGLKTRLAGVIGDPGSGGRGLIEAAAALDAATREALLQSYDRFVLYDSVRLPLAWGSVGESNRVEVIRISPQDATAIVDEIAGRSAVPPRPPKLAGIEIGHFGGFFRLDWRENDMLWGRLDAAERIIRTVLPADRFGEKLVAGLVEDAQRAIVAEEKGLPAGDTAAADAAIEALRTTPVDRTVRGPRVAGLVGRSLHVTAQVLAHAGGSVAVETVLGALRALLWTLALALAPTGRALLLVLGVNAAVAAVVAAGAAVPLHWLARTGWTLAAVVVVADVALLTVYLLGRTIQLAPKKPPPSRSRRLATTAAAVLAALAVVALGVLFAGALLDGVHVSAALDWLPGW